MINSDQSSNRAVFSCGYTAMEHQLGLRWMIFSNKRFAIHDWTVAWISSTLFVMFIQGTFMNLANPDQPGSEIAPWRNDRKKNRSLKELRSLFFTEKQPATNRIQTAWRGGIGFLEKIRSFSNSSVCFIGIKKWKNNMFVSKRKGEEKWRKQRSLDIQLPIEDQCLNPKHLLPNCPYGIFRVHHEGQTQIPTMLPARRFDRQRPSRGRCVPKSLMSFVGLGLLNIALGSVLAYIMPSLNPVLGQWRNVEGLSR